MRDAKNFDEDGFRYLSGPIHKFVTSHKAGGMLLGGPVWGRRESFFADQVNRHVVQWVWATDTEKCLMNVVEELKKNYDAAAELWSAYEKRLQEFRSSVKNDITSLEAGARRTTEAVAKMNKAYGDVLVQLNGPDMKQAIENAERLARAMESLASLQSHKLTFAVIDAKSNGKSDPVS